MYRDTTEEGTSNPCRRHVQSFAMQFGEHKQNKQQTSVNTGQTLSQLDTMFYRKQSQTAVFDTVYSALLSTFSE